MPELHLTKIAIEALQVPAGKRVRFHDAGPKAVRHLVLAVAGGTGRRVFYHYRRVGKQVVETKLGVYPEMTIDQARREAETLNVQVGRGVNPAKVRAAARAELTLVELFTWHGENFTRRQATVQADRRRLELYFPELLPLKASAITRQDIRRLHAQRGKVRPAPSRRKLAPGEEAPPPVPAKGTEANRALALLRVLFKRAILEGMCPGPNPVEGLEFHKEQSRERRLMPDEVERFFAAVDAEPNETIRDYVLLSLLTGQRKANVLAMRWEDINMERGVWRIPVTKNGSALTVPLEDQELRILRARQAFARGPWVLPGMRGNGEEHLSNPYKGWARIVARAGIEDFRLHDLRRTMGSWMADSGAGLNVIGKALGHKSQTATLIYARLSLDPVREAKRVALGAIEAARRGVILTSP